MKMVDFFSARNKEHWMEQIKCCDWEDAQRLSNLIIEGNFHNYFGSGNFYLLIHDKQLISFGTLTQKDCIKDEGLYPWIGCIYTLPIYRGNRYSQRVIDRLLSKAVALGFSCVYLATEHIGLYEKYGFTYLKNRIDVYGIENRIYFKNIV